MDVDLATPYDLDRNERIGKAEVLLAEHDYLHRVIAEAEARDVVRRYFVSGIETASSDPGNPGQDVTHD